MYRLFSFAIAAICLAAPAAALDRPWISAVYFYWYEWDYQRRWGNWVGGVYNQPLYGYYDSRRLSDNIRSLRTACEWGLTHFFMDYWSESWRDERGRHRELCVLDAAQRLRQAGYDIWMSYYQDGWDFRMDDFAANLDPGRAVEGWVRRYAKLPVWPKIAGRPFQLVYGRNGVPKITATDEGFRRWLKRKYGTIEKLNHHWRTNYKSFSNISWTTSARGARRADAIVYQYELWAQSWAELNRRVRQRFGYPGIAASFDIGYGPFRGWSYALMAKTFAGPHSYGGVFGQPHDADAQRFIQAQIAKFYGTVFFDTFKNFYCDWGIRIPGFAYPPEPLHFDRFWTVALAHYAEALLHLSWNEWWEGSNLEPCWEHGKTYCEKNLLYATVMKTFFPHIRRAGTTGRVALILNDWQWLADGRMGDDIYAAIQALRRASVDFALIPDDFVTPERLAQVDLVVAPSAGVGLGFNARGEPIADVLWRWLQAKPSRRLLLDALPGDDAAPATGQQLRRRLGLKAAPPQPSAMAPKSINAFIDIGADDDDKFLISGYSHAEDWGRLREGEFGASKARYTVRWCPGTGSATALLVPVAPGREHILEIRGDAIWPNRVQVLINGRLAASFDIRAGRNVYTVRLPALCMPQIPIAVMELRFEREHIPGRIDPERFGNESRVCNLAIDYIHIRTPDQPADKRQPARLPVDWLKTTDHSLAALAGCRLPMKPRESLAAEGARILSRYGATGTARDMLVCGGRVWYCNGLFEDLPSAGWWRAVLKWAGLDSPWRVTAPNVIGAHFAAGSTHALAAYNTDITKPQAVSLEVPADPQGWPLAEAQAITLDGQPLQPIQALKQAESSVRAKANMRYCGIFQFTFCPVRPSKPELRAVPGGEVSATIELANLTSRRVAGRLGLLTYLPSITAPWVEFSLAPHQRKTIRLPIRATEMADWGHKTAVLAVDIAGRRAYFWRPLIVYEHPSLSAHAVPLGTDEVAISVSARWHDRFLRPPATVPVRIAAAGRSAASRTFPCSLKLPRSAAADGTVTVQVTYELLRCRFRKTLRLDVAQARETAHQPPNAVAAFYVRPVAHIPLPAVLTPSQVGLEKWPLPMGVVGPDGQPVPCALPEYSDMPLLLWLPPMPSTKPVGPFFIVASRVQPAPSDTRLIRLPNGRLTLRNSFVSITADPAKGGCITELRYLGGPNLLRRPLGASWGLWGKYNPLKPRISAPKYIARERRAYQFQRRGKVEAYVEDIPAPELHGEATGPGFSILLSTAIVPYAPLVPVRAEAALSKRGPVNIGDELILLDLQLARGRCNKIYPNFTGKLERARGEAPHAGWREASYLPPVATVMDAATLRGCLSLIAQPEPFSDALDRWRQGFWPQSRPKPGPIDTVRLEAGISSRAFLSTGRAVASYLLALHNGGFAAALDASEQMNLDALLARIIPAKPAGPTIGLCQVPGDWWHPLWPVRFPIDVPAGSSSVEAAMPLQHNGRWLDPRTAQAILNTPDGPLALPTLAQLISDRAWKVHINLPEDASGRLFVYVRFCEAPPEAPRMGRNLAPDPSFESGRGWGMRGDHLIDNPSLAHSGRRCVMLHTASTRPGAFDLLATNAVPVLPNARYKLSFWARCDKPGCRVITNFFINSQYDFDHVVVSLRGDGKWHKYKATVPTGDFPAGARPLFRIWVYHQPAPVFIDDIHLELIQTQPRGPSIRPGPAETLAPLR